MPDRPPAGRPERLSARQLIDRVLDAGSFVSWDEPPVRNGWDEAYRADLDRAQEVSGADEAVLTGEGTMHGRRVAVIVSEYGFLAGSIGIAAADRLVRAIERATSLRLPLLAAPASGGTRMHEGTVAFVQMVRISAAIAAHKSAALPYLVYLRHPTTGGVMASWGSLGHVTVAEPGALVGFLGPRVYAQLYGAPFPDDVQTAENLFRCGVVDAVLPADEIASVLSRALAVLSATPESQPEEPLAPAVIADFDAWDAVTRSRRSDRPGVRRLLRLAASDVVPLSGTGHGESDPGLMLALASFGSTPCVVLGEDRKTQREVRPLGPAALREARRGIRLAAELSLPLVTVIDTPGAALSPEAEEGGLAREIAHCLADLVSVRTPVLSLLLGEGTGGGALALLPGDRVIAAQYGWLSPLPPEGASAIVHRTTDFAPQMARAHGIRSIDLMAAGVVDRIVPEYPDAADEPAAFCDRIAEALRYELAGLTRVPVDELVAERRGRLVRMGRTRPRDQADMVTSAARPLPAELAGSERKG